MAGVDLDAASRARAETAWLHERAQAAAASVGHPLAV
jgi:hypothetical protein